MAVNIGALIPSLVGLGAEIGGNIPALRKPKRVNVGSQAVRKAGAQLAVRATGAAQSGRGASRGLALREGIRGASKIAGAAAAEGAEAALRDEAFYQQQLLDRNARLAEFVGGAAEGLATMGASFIKPQTPEVSAAEEALQQQPEMQDTATGLDPLGGAVPSVAMPPEQKSLESEALQPPEGSPGLADLEAQAEGSAGPLAQFESTRALERLRAAKPTTLAPELEADLENRLQAKKLMLQDAERLGINLDGIMANMNRRLGLKPGQSVQNPYGVKLDLEG